MRRRDVTTSVSPEKQGRDREQAPNPRSTPLPPWCPAMRHRAWHRESDGWTFWVAFDPDGNVRSAYAADEIVPPGTVIDWEACNELEQMTLDIRAGGWHEMHATPVDWPCSLAPIQ